MKNIEIDYFKFKYNKVKPKQGLVLVSEPFLTDLYFQRSVVFLTEHNKAGSVGFILNKPVEMKINEVLTDFPAIDAQLSVGGPVSTNTIHYLHTYGEIIPNSVQIFNSIYWGGDFNAIKQIISKRGYEPEKLRFFLGYSGWSAGQLDDELAANSWIVTDTDEASVMKPDIPDMWKNSLAKLGKNFRVWANSPSNPSLN